jgi:fumarate reductase subunit D
MQQRSLVIHALILIIGLLLVIMGILITEALYSTICIAIGGAVIGAVIGNLFTIIGFDPNNFMENSHRLPFATHSDKLDDFRSKYYCYYLSKSNGEYKWRLGQLNYESYHSALYLTGYLKIKDDEGNSYV